MTPLAQDEFDDLDPSCFFWGPIELRFIWEPRLDIGKMTALLGPVASLISYKK